MASPGPRRMPARQSAAVYRRRRIVVGALLLVILVCLWWAGSAIFALLVDEDPDDPAAQETKDSEQDAGSSEGGSEDGSDEGAGNGDSGDEADDADEDSSEDDGSCAPGDIRITAGTDDDSYGSLVAPTLIMTVENTGSEDCTLDVGTAEQEFSVSHAGREVFTTAQCDGEEDSYEMTMEPGQQERAQLTWPRSDSSVSCTEPAELEPGTYELTVSIGGITSDPHRFTLD